MLEDILSARQRVFGEHYPFTLATRTKLAAERAKADQPYQGKMDVQRPFPITVCTYTPDEGCKYTRSFA